MPRIPKPVKRGPSMVEKTCDICGKVCNARGYHNHHRVCLRNQEERDRRRFNDGRDDMDVELSEQGTLPIHSGRKHPWFDFWTADGESGAAEYLLAGGEEELGEEGGDGKLGPGVVSIVTYHVCTHRIKCGDP